MGIKHKAPSFFDSDNKLRVVSSLGDQLEKLNTLIDWEEFRPDLKDAFGRGEMPDPRGGRPAFDYVLRFKILVLAKLYDLSDDQAEYQINDRRSFLRFLGLYDQDKVPDAKSIWHWREILTRGNAFDTLFDRFWQILDEKNIKASKGEIIDATFVDVPRQRNSRDENKQIKEGEIPADWQKPKNESMLRQKDTDARWTKKNDEKHFGYKNHVVADRKTKLIRRYVTTHAAVHDSQVLDDLIKDSTAGTAVYADSAYTGRANLEKLKAKGLRPRINEKGYKNRPLTETQKSKNREKSRVRSRVEHVFAFITGKMQGDRIRSIGLLRARNQNALTNLVYNLCRFVFLMGAKYA